jgi:hypothetical protein
MADREVRVKLTADVSEYIAAMNKAAKATRRVNSDRLWAWYVRVQCALIGSLVTVLVLTMSDTIR